MPEETITIGGKSFEVACQEGEEQFLHAAAAMLDAEAQALISQIGRLPEARMLLMAGLMLADKTAGAEDRVRALETELASAQSEIEALKSVSKPADAGPSVSDASIARLTQLAEQAEALAEQIEAQ